MNTETVTIKRIGPTSALKVSAAVGLVLGVVYAALGNLVINDAAERRAMIIVAVLGGAVGGGISGMVMAWIYNMALRLTGGLQLEISVGLDEKDKRVPPSIGSMMSSDE
ncbi:MAG: hypothetical protein OXP68_13530 [Anaerolineaceae bacterium]|nr:hypothetical protein [Anaerolineaceae bacterium]MDE0328860.1 hypothetical protein [Anaerolineaceae bacterium]